MCDVTGQELSTPFKLGFKYNGQELVFDVSPEIAQRFVLTLASKVDSEDLESVLDEVFGRNWRPQQNPHIEDDEEMIDL